jgi:phage shock protein C
VPKRLVRDTRRGVVAGVAAGVGEYLDVDPVLVRLAFVLLVFANGLGLLAYLICWLVVPRGETVAAASGGTDSGAKRAAEAGVEAVREAGARFASEVLGWLRWPYWANVQTLWPLLLVALGVGLIVKSRRSATA